MAAAVFAIPFSQDMAVDRGPCAASCAVRSIQDDSQVGRHSRGSGSTRRGALPAWQHACCLRGELPGRHASRDAATAGIVIEAPRTKKADPGG